MASELPAFPRFVFTIFEPLSLIAGWLGPLVSTPYFVSRQLPTSQHPPISHTAAGVAAGVATMGQYPLRAHETILALQVGNCYLLLTLLGLFILNTTKELSVVRAYLWALWLGDVGHVAVTAYVMGAEAVRDVGGWNAVIWGNIGITVFLFTTRSLYFLGFFGEGPGRRRGGIRGESEIKTKAR